MSSLVPADANHILRTFMQALHPETASSGLDGQVDSAVASVAHRVLEILGSNGLMVVQAGT